MKIVFVSPTARLTAEWSTYEGVLPTARHAAIACSLLDAGHDVRLFVDEKSRTFADLAAAISREAPDLTVLDTTTAWLASGLRRHLDVSTAEITHDLRGRGMYDGDTESFLAALGVGPVPASTIGPYARGLLSIARAPQIGVEVAWTSRTGALHCHEDIVIAAELAAIDRARNAGTSVELVGAGEGDAAAVAERLQALSKVPLRHVRTHVVLNVANFTSEVIEATRPAHHVGELRLFVDTSTPVDKGSLRARFLEAAGNGLAVTALLAINDVDVTAITNVASLAALLYESGVPFSWHIPSQTSGAMAEEIDRALAPYSPATTRARRIDTGSLAFAFAVSGQSGPTRSSDMTPQQLLVMPGVNSRPPAAALDLVSLDGHVFIPHTSRESQQERGNERGWSGLDANLLGIARVEGDQSVEVMAYREGRDVEPFGPTILRLVSQEDIAALLDDADVAHQTGTFRPYLFHPMVAIADDCAFRGVDSCRSTTMASLVATCDDGAWHLRLSPTGAVIGSAEEPLSVIRSAVRDLAIDLQQRRGCATCPIVSTCSKDACLAAVLDDEDYCRERQSRPWLPSYFAALDALRALGGPGAGQTRVSGFGQRLILESAPAPSRLDRDDPLLIEHNNIFMLLAADGRRVALRPDTVGVVEAMLEGGDLESAAQWLSDARHLELPRATEVATTVIHQLTERGFAFSALQTVRA